MTPTETLTRAEEPGTSTRAGLITRESAEALAVVLNIAPPSCGDMVSALWQAAVSPSAARSMRRRLTYPSWPSSLPQRPRRIMVIRRPPASTISLATFTTWRPSTTSTAFGRALGHWLRAGTLPRSHGPTRAGCRPRQMWLRARSTSATSPPSSGRRPAGGRRPPGRRPDTVMSVADRLGAPVIAMVEPALGVHRAVELPGAEGGVYRGAFGSIDFSLDIDAVESAESVLGSRGRSSSSPPEWPTSRHPWTW